jgi:hypothetical protein
MEPFVKIPVQENKFVSVTASPNLKCMQTQVLLDNALARAVNEWKLDQVIFPRSCFIFKKNLIITSKCCEPWQIIKFYQVPCPILFIEVTLSIPVNQANKPDANMI